MICPDTIGVQLKATEVEKKVTACRVGKVEVIAQHMLQFNTHVRLTALRMYALASANVEDFSSTSVEGSIRLMKARTTLTKPARLFHRRFNNSRIPKARFKSAWRLPLAFRGASGDSPCTAIGILDVPFRAINQKETREKYHIHITWPKEIFVVAGLG
jgi:hypothetical protein